ncbi:MAG: undecaprenyl-diphosphate phosphatase [Planctomycetes bacterium]|nr:undecaprenyl-diphosphate phosphatase [Planctomycetota bacterium]
MPLWEIILLGIVQGLTEFLPVSSSGHLVVANSLLEWLGNEPVENLLEVSIVLHLGTLVAVLVFYRREIVRLLGDDRRVIPILIVGTIPAVVFGLLLKKGMDADLVLENPLLSGLMFPVTAAVLLWVSRRAPSDIEYTQLTWQKSLAIGLMQAIAILPGISRSGFTIAAGLGVGLSRQSAATYAFLLAIPTIGGAGLLEGIDAMKEGTTGTPILNLLIGFLVSFGVGWVALKLLVRWVQQGRLAMFAYYLFPLGVAVVAWQLMG